MQRHIPGAWSVSGRISGPRVVMYSYKLHDAQNRMVFHVHSPSKRAAFQNLCDLCRDECDGDDLVLALLAISAYGKAHPRSKTEGRNR